jgi:hypothetical protein
MNAISLTRKLTLSAVSLAALAGSTVATMPHAAHADDGSRPGTGVLKSLDGGSTWQAAHVYSKTLTFTLSTTSPLLPGTEFDVTSGNGGAASAKGGNIEFEWKVEEGESAPPAGVDDLTAGDGGSELVRGRVTGWWPREEPPRTRSTDGVNVGVGELQEPSSSKPADASTPNSDMFALDSATASDDGFSLSLNFEKYTMTFTEYGKDGAKRGNVEFEWKVEAGES